MRRDKSWSHEVLLTVLQGLAPGGLLGRGEPADWEQLARAATHHGLQGLLAEALRGRPEVPGGFQLELQGAAVRLMARREAHLRTAAAALGAVTSTGIRPVVLKGPGVAERYYAQPYTRPYGDIDLLIRPEELRSTVRTLEDAGFQVVDRNWDLLVADLRGQLHLVRPNGSTIELHWHVINGARQRRTLDVTTAPLEDRTFAWELRGHPCRALAPEAEVAYLCLHAALHGAGYALWLADIGMIARRAEVDWDAALGLLGRWRARRAGLVVLDLVRAFVEPTVPHPSDRRRRAWERRAVERWDLGRVDEPKPLRKLLLATTADDVRTMLRLVGDAVVPPRAASRRSLNGTLGRLSWGTVRRIRRKLHPEETSSPEFAPGPGNATMETYLGEVEAYAAARRS